MKLPKTSPEGQGIEQMIIKDILYSRYAGVDLIHLAHDRQP
jgi:hypothetical protein